MKFPATHLKKCIFPYVAFLGQLKLQDLYISQHLQYITVLEDAIKKNVAPTAMETSKPNSYDEAKYMFSKMMSEAATANIADKEVRELAKMYLKQSTRLDALSNKLEELQDQFKEKNSENALPPWGTYEESEALAFQETIGREMSEYNKMYASLILELPGLNISNASDASVDFILKRFFKLDEATERRVLDEWVAFKSDLQLAMEKFDFTLYLLDNKSYLIFKGDYEGLANVVRSEKEMLAKNHREEAVFELLQNWKNYKAKGALKKKVKSFKERIQQQKKHQYEMRMNAWIVEAALKRFYRSTNMKDLDMCELWHELQDEDASQCAIPEGRLRMDINDMPTGLRVMLRP